MSAPAVLIARLSGQTSAGARVYPLILPQEPTYPAVSYQQISAVRTHAMGGDIPIVRVRMQLNAWGKTYAEARILAGEIEGRLKRFRGAAGGVVVLDIVQDNEVDGYESDTQTRRITQDYTIYLSEV